ncbi:CoA-binding protein [Piscinibacter sp.]|jgi:predicted CoA-binding protein|uniref:CoA-binding protein n=1 Tax=Piscinibacter sp. TaxID=1903157 RepID=UPI00355A2ECA
MNHVPTAVAEFLAGKRFAVAGVSRSGQQPANAVLRKLRDCGFDVVAINPHANQLEGSACYPDLASVPGVVDGLVVVTHPDVAAELVRQAAARGVRQIWFHRSFGGGSVSDAALQACAELGIRPIVGGCPLMYCQPVDVAHRCFRWWLGRTGRIPV